MRRLPMVVAALVAATGAGALPGLAAAAPAGGGPFARLAVDEAACGPGAVAWSGTLALDLPAGATVTSTYAVGAVGEAATVLDQQSLVFPAAITLTQPAEDEIGLGASSPGVRPYVYEHRTEVRVAGATEPTYTQWARIACDASGTATVTLTESFAGSGTPTDPGGTDTPTDPDGTAADTPPPPAVPIAATPRYTG